MRNLRLAARQRIREQRDRLAPDAGDLARAVEIAGPPARIALALLPYAALGIEEFMISGSDRPGDIARMGRETIWLLANSVARR